MYIFRPHFRSILIVTISVMLPACVTSLESLRKSDLKGDGFQLQLARQYLDFAELEADDYDWFNSAYFARKGLKALKGENPAPENLEKWSIPEEVMPILVQAREYLTLVLKPEITDKFPQQAAGAQFMFDCWVEQQEEGWQQEHIAYCRDQFYSILDGLFAATVKGEELPEKPMAADIKAFPPSDTKLAYFKTGSAKMDDTLKRLISNITSRLKNNNSYNITLNGYADMVGSEKYNMKLSKERAVTIKKALIDGGLDGKAITVFAFGSENAPVKTKRGVAVRANRVVEIIIDWGKAN